MLTFRMWLARVPCALALSWAVACSFPDYVTLPEGAGGGPAVPASCKNGLRDGREDKVDCGGPDCDPCPECSDGLKNGEETGVDCGGACEACPTCTDGVQNGSESDQDCGGICSQRCEMNQRCRQGTDCASLICADNVCQPSSCNDQVRNGTETDKDCGGACEACANGESCMQGSDCVSSRCQSGVCVSAACTDGIRNGKESDVDCGGGECARCTAGQKCGGSDDCVSRICGSNQRCAEPSCTDATQNQDEADVDCGGTECEPCEAGAHCRQGEDCASGLCQSGLCVPESSGGQPLGRAGWTLRTSESGAEATLGRAIDPEISTCWTSGTPQYAGMYVELDLGEPRYFFKARIVVETPPFDRDVPSSLAVYVSNDGTYGDPVQVVTGFTWTWIDLPVAQVGRYVRLMVTKSSDRPWSIGDITLYD